MNGPPDRNDAVANRGSKVKWTEDETKALVKGCNKHGVGSWAQILSDPELRLSFEGRSPSDLKDWFRTGVPDSYRQMHSNAKTYQGNQSCGRAPGVRSVFEKGKAKERNFFTVEEDEALLQGYRKHGAHWAIITRDPVFLNRRRSTDVRDRFRNAFPEEYARAGYKPRRKGKKSTPSKVCTENKEDAAQPNKASTHAPSPCVPAPISENSTPQEFSFSNALVSPNLCHFSADGTIAEHQRSMAIASEPVMQYNYMPWPDAIFKQVHGAASVPNPTCPTPAFGYSTSTEESLLPLAKDWQVPLVAIGPVASQNDLPFTEPNALQNAWMDMVL
ncbi:hypothetical protein MVES1_003171 [Malassezia vespertilionis]|uniref:Myb-like domain-containing protein n=1 Tax=Malassezia vespertilionis TaxID=2020962 RepID=A0A2N1J8Y9_9BASI|nr:uncharacterized protein MVES1_003171 [Malassezia vespertilionis]PKI83027.1 hypothetical protein MVES_003010 [Malassezia vespertilionis]WFD07800.1 hypothetical protein MVES1_003171 [Malassezia vespertilionis]